MRHRLLSLALFSLACLAAAPHAAHAQGLNSERGTPNIPIGANGETVLNIFSDGGTPATNRVGINNGTAIPQATLDVGGEVKIGSTGLPCSAATAGAMRYEPSQGAVYFCNGSSWVNMASAAISPSAAQSFQTVTQTLCKRGGNYDVTAQCPPDMNLVYCAGGPGDQDESHEYWILEPDYVNRRCIGHAGQPACFGDYYSQIIVEAICAPGGN